MVCQYDWGAIATGGGAVATLIVGLGAVWAAWTVGNRQAGIADKQATIAGRQAGIQAEQAAIAKRQTEILERQVTHADSSNRINLFDRRMATYQIIKTYLAEIAVEMVEADKAENNRRFSEKLLESRFLFDETVFEWMDEIRRSRISLEIEMAQAKVGSAEYRAAASERVFTIMSWADDQTRDMPKIFGEFMILSAPRREIATSADVVDAQDDSSESHS